VQHYFRRLADAAAHFLFAHGSPPFGSEAPRLLCRHVRFLRELAKEDLVLVETATACRETGPAGTFAITHRLIEPTRGFVAAAGIDLYAGDIGCETEPEIPPDDALPRGLPEEPAAEPRALAELLALGYRESNRGVIQLADLDPDGITSVASIVAHLSDSSAYAWENAGIPRSEIDGVGRGRATLEIKVTPLEPARAGDPIAIVSGATSVSRTILAFREVMFNVGTGRALAVTQKIAVLLDHGTRRVVRLPEALRAAVSARVVAG
jgi:acyl-CoA thioesterase FadM